MPVGRRGLFYEIISDHVGLVSHVKTSEGLFSNYKDIIVSCRTKAESTTACRVS